MLVFWRPAFNAGVMVVKDRDNDANVCCHVLEATQMGVELDIFNDEDFVKECYPQWAMTLDEYNAKRTARRQDRADHKAVTF